MLNDGASVNRGGVWKIVVLLLALVLNGTLVVRLLWGPQSIIAYNALRAQAAEMRNSIAAADAENLALSNGIRLLRASDVAKAQAIRERLNYARENEVLYLFPNKQPKGSGME